MRSSSRRRPAPVGSGFHTTAANRRLLAEIGAVSVSGTGPGGAKLDRPLAELWRKRAQALAASERVEAAVRGLAR